MFGSRERPMATEDNRIIPVEQYGLRLMSMGFLLDDAAPAILRGPMVTRYTQQFLRQVEWGELDYLVLDLPPGTGDIQLTIVQTVALAGAIIVTTPQEVALIDARKASAMFEKVNVPVLGLIENMSYFVSPSDGQRYDIFGSGGGEREAKRIRVPLLGQIPIDIATREAGDRGMPVTAETKESPVSAEFMRIAGRLREILPDNVMLALFRGFRLNSRRLGSSNAGDVSRTALGMIFAMNNTAEMDSSDDAGSHFLKNSVLYKEFLAEREEILKHKWIESEKAGSDIGFEKALLDWIVKHRSQLARTKSARDEADESACLISGTSFNAILRGCEGNEQEPP